MSTQPLILAPPQEEHHDRLLTILHENPFAFDFSEMGTGKTYTSCAVFETLGLKHLIVICPAPVKGKWRGMVPKYGLNATLVAVDSFAGCSGKRFKQPKHGLLTRRDYTVVQQMSNGQTREIEKSDYTTTADYKKVVAKGALVVIDEIHNVKSFTTLATQACRTLLKAVVDNFTSGGESRCLLLSGTPADTPAYVSSFFRLVGIMRSDRMCYYNPATGELVWDGMKQIEDYMLEHHTRREVEAALRKSIEHPVEVGSNESGKRRQKHPGATDFDQYCYRLFIDLLMHRTVSSMPPLNLNWTVTKQNAYYRLPGDDTVALMARAIAALRKASGYNDDTQTVNFGDDPGRAIGRIQKALVVIETLKIAVFARVARMLLESHPHRKVIIAVNYTATVDDLMEQLEPFDPLEFTGRTPAARRATVLEAFQAPTDTNRVLIMNIRAGNSGIDLDDQHGAFPRHVLVNPNYSSINLHQLSHRTYRANTKSDSTFQFVFGMSPDGEKMSEMNILRALSRKGAVMKELTPDQVEHGTVFPGDYEEFLEAGSASTPP